MRNGSKLKLAVLALILLVGVGAFIWTAKKNRPKPPYSWGGLTPVEAYEMLKKDPKHTFLIDCRSMAEYEFVGHPTMAYNIPYKFWTPQGFETNPDFVKDVAEKFQKTDKLILISSSERRSSLTRNILATAGFKHVFYVLGGFEGSKAKKKSKVYYGYRRYIDGWRHDKLPYTYELDKEFIYKLHSCGCE